MKRSARQRGDRLGVEHRLVGEHDLGIGGARDHLRGRRAIVDGQLAEPRQLVPWIVAGVERVAVEDDDPHGQRNQTHRGARRATEASVFRCALRPAAAVLGPPRTAMHVRGGFIDLIGNTPLVRLRKASEQTGCEILGKCEFLNPGGSVKDRAALFIVRDAEARGLLQPGGVIVEGTAGNTGIGLALVADALGYRTVIVMPETQSQEKKDMLRLCRAELRLVPARAVQGSGQLRARLRAARRRAGAQRAVRRDLGQPVRQPRQPARALRDHRAGDLAADRRRGRRLRRIGRHRRHARRRRHGAEGAQAGACASSSPIPLGSALYHYYAHGELKAEGDSITEGIGQGRITANLEGAPIDDALQVTDAEALPIIFDLLAEEGLVRRRLDRHQRRRRDPGRARSSARATPSSPCCATTARAIRASCSTPTSCARKGLPVPAWLGVSVRTDRWHRPSIPTPPASASCSPPFARGDIDAVRAVIPEHAVWHFPGRRGQLAGTHRGREAIFAFLLNVQALTGGTFHLELIDVLANDAHAVALFRGHGERNGKDARQPDLPAHARWRTARCVEVWEFVWDLFAVDEFWS